jgi:20S proteasome alpha/beta subunit
MTTIAYRDGVLAADTQMTAGGWIRPGRAKKLMRLEDGTLLGICGTYATALKAMSQAAAGEDVKTVEDDTVVRIAPDGSIDIFQAGASYALEGAEFYAWGSGHSVALGAMHAGASAEEAVRIATLVDNETGGDVVSVRHEA